MSREIHFEATEGGVTVAVAETDITWNLAGADTAGLKASDENIQTYVFRLAVATTNCTSFKVYGKVHDSDSTWSLLAGNAVADYTLGDSPFVKYAQVYSSAGALVDKDLTTIDATETGVLVLANPGFAQIKITMTTGASTATVTGYVSGYEADVTTGGLSNTSTLDVAFGTGLTFTRVGVDQTAAAGVTALIGALASNYSRLHRLQGTGTPGGTLTLEDSDGTALSGPMPFGANGGFNFEWVAHKDGTPITAIGKGLSINTSQKFYGFGIVSQSTLV